MSDTPTPRTDEATYESEGSINEIIEFARTLERELTARDAEVAQLRSEVARLRKEIDALTITRKFKEPT